MQNESQHLQQRGMCAVKATYLVVVFFSFFFGKCVAVVQNAKTENEHKKKQQQHIILCSQPKNYQCQERKNSFRKRLFTRSRKRFAISLVSLYSMPHLKNFNISHITASRLLPPNLISHPAGILALCILPRSLPVWRL